MAITKKKTGRATQNVNVSGDRKLHTLIRRAVREEIRALLDDPDFGLPLRASVVQRLTRSKQSKRSGKTRTADEVIARLGLKV
ncbi:MAG: hypothetical protein ABIG71_04275 [Candidatus Uhrbacteria bacterium]